MITTIKQKKLTLAVNALITCIILSGITQCAVSEHKDRRKLVEEFNGKVCTDYFGNKHAVLGVRRDGSFIKILVMSDSGVKQTLLESDVTCPPLATNDKEKDSEA